jgi:hypothetical protein
MQQWEGQDIPVVILKLECAWEHFIELEKQCMEQGPLPVGGPETTLGEIAHQRTQPELLLGEAGKNIDEWCQVSFSGQKRSSDLWNS